jgi:hypothetical protein
LKVRLLLDGGTPKVPPSELRRVVEASGMQVNEGPADFGIVVGGDGKFSRYGRTEEVPLLFVGVRSKGATGSKAHLAATTFDKLPDALKKIGEGKYSVKEHRRLGVLLNGKSVGEVYTDVYMQRGNESDCIRYRVRISGPGIAVQDSAIGDGIVVATKAGSTGYYSYPDRIKGDWMDPSAFAKLPSDKVGICHINPTYTEREGTHRHPLRYAVPWGSKVELSLFREADARLYGTTDEKSGIKVSMGDIVTVVAGLQVTKLVVLDR